MHDCEREIKLGRFLFIKHEEDMTYDTHSNYYLRNKENVDNMLSCATPISMKLSLAGSIFGFVSFTTLEFRHFVMPLLLIFHSFKL